METLVQCACGALNRPKPLSSTQRLVCGKCGNKIPAPSMDDRLSERAQHVHVKCPMCKKINRLGRVGPNQHAQCAICHRTLPDPEILLRLLDVRNELDYIDRHYGRTNFWRYHELEQRLRRQEAIIANLPQFPAYRRTRAACFDLGVEIDLLLMKIHEREKVNIKRVAIWVFGEFFGALHLVLGVPRPELPPGLR